jgi:hypothetical protein
MCFVLNYGKCFMWVTLYHVITHNVDYLDAFFVAHEILVSLNVTQNNSFPFLGTFENLNYIWCTLYKLRVSL